MTAEIIRLWAQKPIRACSFCKTPERQTKKLIANGKVGTDERLICDRCIFEARLRIRELPEATA